MKAVVCTRYGAPDVLQISDVPKPVPKDNEILVKIMATAVNSGDVRVRSLDAKGILRPIMRLVVGISKPRKPILGTVFSGVIESVGSTVTKFKVGENVFGMTGFSFGTYAEYIAVHQNSNATAMPQNVSFEEAAALIFGGQTAVYYLNKAKLATKSTPEILIMGATGSVGIAAVQIAKHYNAHITAVCSTEGQKTVQALGVTNIIRYDKEDVTRHTEKFDVIFDAVGKYRKKQCRHLLKGNGIFTGVQIGYATEKLEQLQFLKELFESGKMKAVIDKTFNLDEIVAAHRYVDTGRKKGNVVIKVSQSENGF